MANASVAAIQNYRDSAFFRMRQWEYELIASALTDILPDESIGALRLMEYGCGVGIGAPSLSRLGELTITDVQRHPFLCLPPHVQFLVTDIHQTNFRNGYFDVLISNQVLEYLDVQKAIKELKRIGGKEAYYAFAVPTSFWLIMSQPGNVVKKIENLLSRMKWRTRKKRIRNPPGEETLSISEGRRWRRWMGKACFFTGHGRNTGFFSCLTSWRVACWERLLVSNGFAIVKKAPLLTYGSSVLPIIPTNRIMAKMGLSSSYIFICQKSDEHY